MLAADTKILLVDDDPAMLRLVSTWLEKAGYPVQCVADGQQALTAIDNECPDILLTDWEMPNVDGLELCRRLRALDLPHYIYIVFLSVKSTSAEMIEGLEIGADDFLTKPIDRGELLARMRSGARVIELERRLSRMARTDSLTGLMSRRTFYETLAREWERTKRFRLSLSCVMLDLDYFKRINDIHGHSAGDAALKSVAELLRGACRGSDTVCRYGGEEFCIMLPETNEHDAAVWADRVRRGLVENEISLNERIIRVTGSFGVAQHCDDTQTAEDLIDQADQALLCAKHTGRDRVVRYGSLSDSNDLDLEDSNKLGGLFRGIRAQHVMNPVVACLREDETVGQAAEFFLRSRIQSTPVVDAGGKLRGILSEKDLLTALVSLDCWKLPIHEVMKPNVICYEEDTPIRTIYEFICRVAIRQVVIVKDNCPTGIISRGTLLRWFKNLVISKGLLEYRPPPHEAEDFDPHRTKERLAETARELAHQASELESRFKEDDEDLVPYIVGGATGMQELLNDLLAYSRYANQPTGLAAAMQSMLLESNPMD